MAKTRVASRVKAAVGGNKSLNTNQDLVKLAERYHVFVKRLQGLVAALKAHFQAMNAIAKTRYSVAQHLAILSKDTPLFDKTGLMPSAEKPADTVSSYLSIHEGVTGKAKMYGQKYSQFVIDYAVEWEKVVTSRVDKGLKKAEDFRVELDHYQRKVESLRQAANATMAKGKQVEQKAAERLTRNEEKLIKCREAHNTFVHSLCILVDEVTDRSWRDLHPLLVKIAQFDVTLSGDEAKAFTSLNTVVNEMKRLAVTHGIKPQARLKDLDSLDPSALSTRQPGSETLAIEAGLSGLSVNTSNNDIWSPSNGDGYNSASDNDQRLPPGSFGGSGLGGFPVSVKSAASDNVSVGTHSTQGASNFGAPSTLDMMAINASAAPPPTVDMLAAAFGPTPQKSNSSAIVPSPLSGGGHSDVGPRQRNPSYDSFDSRFSGISGTSAPPPAAPPPPPPSQFGTAGAADPNPFGPPAPAPSYGLPPTPTGYSYGAPTPSPGYGQPSSSYYSNTPPPPASNQGYGQQQQYGQQPLYGQPQQYQGYGQKPSTPQYGGYPEQSPANGQSYQTQNRGNNPFG